MARLEGRIVSTEMEYGASVRYGPKDTDKPLMPSLIEWAIDNLLPSGLKWCRGFLSNGARYYLDHQHPEYSVPEMRGGNLRQLLAAELAGELIVRDTFESLGRHRNGGGAQYSVNKNVASETEAWGYHVSVQSLREYWTGLNGPWVNEHLRNDPAFKFLGLYLAAANVLIGAGGMHPIPRKEGEEDGPDPGYQFVLGQKSMFLTEDYSLATVDPKPVVNLRDEVLGDRSKYVRLHITSHDPNISPWASMMKWGMDDLVVSCVEEGLFPDWDFDLSEGDLWQFSQHVAQDLTCKKPFEFKCGKRLSGLDVLRITHAQFVKLAERIDLPKGLLWVISQMGKALSDVDVDPMLLENRSDWVLRHKMLGKVAITCTKADENGFTGWSHQQVRDRSYVYDQLSTQYTKDGKSIPDFPTKLRTQLKSWAELMPSEEEVEYYKLNPPRDTRAWIRGKIIKLLGVDKGMTEDKYKRIFMFRWDEVSIFVGNDGGVIGLPGDPRESELPDLDAILEEALTGSAMSQQLRDRLPRPGAAHRLMQ